MEKKKLKGGRVHRTKRQKIAVSKKIINDFLDGDYTLDSICKSHGVSPRTFRNWVRRPTLEEIESGINRGFIAEVAALYEESKELAWSAQERRLLEVAHLALLKAIEGFYYETVYRKVEINEETGEEEEWVYKKIQKYRPPSTKLIIWVLEALEPERWRVGF